jgi:hypothetical protein
VLFNPKLQTIRCYSGDINLLQMHWQMYVMWANDAMNNHCGNEKEAK